MQEKEYSLLDHRQFLVDIISRSKHLSSYVTECEKSIAIIDAMAEEDRKAIESLGEQKIARIALGAETTSEEVRDFLFQFKQTRELFQKISRMNWWQKFKMMLGIGKL